MFTTLYEDKVVALGGTYALDGRVSWVPAGAIGYQPSNCYLLLEGSERLLVDSGLAVHSQEIMDDLVELLEEDGRLSMFFTRSEMDCVSNLEPIAGKFDIERLFTGGAINPFDAFDDLSRLALRGRRHQIDQKGEGGDSMSRTPEIEVAPGRLLTVESPLLRLLPTFWGWDASTGTIFTSDTFTHGTMDNPDGPRVIDSLATDTTTAEQVAQHLYAKYEWIPRATTEPLREWLADKFETLAPETIAPSRGCVIQGRAVVRRHLDYMLSALAQQQA
ncbi:hypothetical protein ACQCSX_02655 [Pseudarthrobacter sp. P1]|uniref:hypothetical protein n=1 Tax=Pseudarthrobacter sp. P1 TaxID=3418418 RepID=UPI003CE69BD6